ncbi:26346_t:CDS:2, partial [Racocetra persica]
AIVLRINEDGARALGNLTATYKQYPPRPPLQYAYMNYTYSNYANQYVSIVDGNIWFMVFEAFLTVLCFSAIYFQNTIESFKWINRINYQIELDFPEISPPVPKLPMTVLYAEYVQLAFLSLFVTAAIFLGYKLYGEFGWNIYKKIGAGIHTQLDIFLLMGFQILNLVFLFADAAHNTHTIIIQSVFIVIVIPTLGLGVWGVRTENKTAIIIFALFSVATIANFLYILATFIIQRDEIQKKQYEGIGNPEDRRFAIDD